MACFLVAHARHGAAFGFQGCCGQVNALSEPGSGNSSVCIPLCKRHVRHALQAAPAEREVSALRVEGVM
jgi:hypothetical protein